MLDMSYQAVYGSWTGSLALDKLHRLCQKQVPILNASVSVVQGFSKMVRVMHLGLDV